MNEAASHAERSYRISRDLEADARSLIGKQADAVYAHLLIDAEREHDQRDAGEATHNTWVATYALARSTSMLAWALGRVGQLEVELSGQAALFACDVDEAAR